MTHVRLPYQPFEKDGVAPCRYEDVYEPDLAIAEVVNGQLDYSNLSENAEIGAGQLASGTLPVKWYTPKIIATEQSTSSTSYTTLSTADEISGVVVPTNSQVTVSYEALWKESSSDAGRAAIFIGSNQLKVQLPSAAPVVQAARTGGSNGHFVPLLAGAVGLVSCESNEEANSSMVATGVAQAIPGEAHFDRGGTKAAVTGAGGVLTVRGLQAGTYAINVQFKSASGSITAKERKLWVEVHG